MKLFEVNSPALELASLVQYLIGKSDELNTKPQIKTDIFIDMARQTGINISFSNLQSLSSQNPLKNMITNINQDTIEFGIANDLKMPVDKARDVVKKMAKRSLSKRT